MKFMRISNYEHQGYERTVWEVMITVPHPDFHKWEAYLLKPNFILFKRPTRSYWEAPDILWNPACHDVKNNKTHPFPDDPTTKKAHKAAELASKRTRFMRKTGGRRRYSRKKMRTPMLCWTTPFCLEVPTRSKKRSES
jgi:hypothetical protein